MTFTEPAEPSWANRPSGDKFLLPAPPCPAGGPSRDDRSGDRIPTASRKVYKPAGGFSAENKKPLTSYAGGLLAPCRGMRSIGHSRDLTSFRRTRIPLFEHRSARDRARSRFHRFLFFGKKNGGDDGQDQNQRDHGQGEDGR